MSVYDSIILGFLEGATEFLPISSTGHLILANVLLGNVPTEFIKSFEIAIQFGAILAVLSLYWRSFLEIEKLQKILVAFIPTGVIGFLLYPLVKTHLLGNPLVVLWALGIGGVILIVFEHFRAKRPPGAKERPMSFRDAVLIGLFQAIAIIPGVSRSAATVVGGLTLGFSRVTIVEFSFLLAVPTLAAAAGFDLLKNGLTFSQDEWGSLFIGFGVSFLVALASIRWLLQYIKRYSFAMFGVYRILLALLFFAFVV